MQRQSEFGPVHTCTNGTVKVACMCLRGIDHDIELFDVPVDATLIPADALDY